MKLHTPPKNHLLKKKYLDSFLFFLAFVLLWEIVYRTRIFPDYAFPSFLNVVKRLFREVTSFAIWKDTVISVWRVCIGFFLAVVLAVPLGLFLAYQQRIRLAVAPMINFFRFISPLAWVPFAILWFSIGDKPAIFIIFVSTFFPLVVSIIYSARQIPEVYFRISKEYSFKKNEVLFKVILPAISPHLLGSMRVCFGISWIVIIAAEMVGCQDGLGYGIWDARNALDLEKVVCYMIAIGVIGIVLDRGFVFLSKIKRV